MSIKQEMNSRTSCIPTKWTRNTVADGQFLQEKTLKPLSARDNFLADAIDELSGNTRSAIIAEQSARIENDNYISATFNSFSSNITNIVYNFSAETLSSFEDLSAQLALETDTRYSADLYLKNCIDDNKQDINTIYSKIGTLEAATDVIAVFGTYDEFSSQSGNLTLTDNDFIKVLRDENYQPSSADADYQTADDDKYQVYYEYHKTNHDGWFGWSAIGSLDPYYSVHEIDTQFDSISSIIEDTYLSADAVISGKNIKVEQIGALPKIKISTLDDVTFNNVYSTNISGNIISGSNYYTTIDDLIVSSQHGQEGADRLSSIAAEGIDDNSATINSMSQGTKNSAVMNSFAFGTANSSKDSSLAGGYINFANHGSIAVGLNTTADTDSMAIGNGDKALTDSLSVGYYNFSNTQSITVGRENTAEYNSLSIGNDNNSRFTAVSIGNDNSSKSNSFVDGVSSKAENYSFAFGRDVSATQGSFAFNPYIWGSSRPTSADSLSVAIGPENSAINNSFIFGQNNSAENLSYIFGHEDIASGGTYIFGNGNLATNYKYIFGNYGLTHNHTADKALFVVSNGQSNNQRNDALMINEDNELYLYHRKINQARERFIFNNDGITFNNYDDITANASPILLKMDALNSYPFEIYKGTSQKFRIDSNGNMFTYHPDTLYLGTQPKYEFSETGINLYSAPDTLAGKQFTLYMNSNPNTNTPSFKINTSGNDLLALKNDEFNLYNPSLSYQQRSYFKVNTLGIQYLNAGIIPYKQIKFVNCTVDSTSDSAKLNIENFNSAANIYVFVKPNTNIRNATVWIPHASTDLQQHFIFTFVGDQSASYNLCIGVGSGYSGIFNGFGNFLETSSLCHYNQGDAENVAWITSGSPGQIFDTSFFYKPHIINQCSYFYFPDVPGRAVIDCYVDSTESAFVMIKNNAGANDPTPI